MARKWEEMKNENIARMLSLTQQIYEATETTASAVKCKNGITEPKSTEMYFGKITIEQQTVCSMHGFVQNTNKYVFFVCVKKMIVIIMI